MSAKLCFREIQRRVKRGKTTGLGHVVVKIGGREFVGRIDDLEYRIAEELGVKTPLPMTAGTD